MLGHGRRVSPRVAWDKIAPAPIREPSAICCALFLHAAAR
jgi:hypothetical protein